jgi:DNA repair protein RadA/Sms
MTEKGIWPFDPTKNIDSVNLQPGQAFAIATLGGKTFPIEVQALTMPSQKPHVTAVGFPTDRVKTILAVISQHTDVPVEGRDVYVNILGGVNFSDTSIDAAVAMAIMSAVTKQPLLSRTAYSGEVDLIGRLKVGERGNQQRDIAERHGFKLVSGESLAAIMSQVKGLKGHV